MQNKLLDLSLDEIKNGYSYNSEKRSYECLVCGKTYEEGEIFPIENRFFDARHAVARHVKIEHQGVLETLLSIDKKYSGLTEKQTDLLRDFARGLTDKEIAQKNGVAASTIRHQKFMFREKAKQAKMYLATFELVEEIAAADSGERLVKTHPGATMVDERYMLSFDENNKIIKNYFIDGDTLKLKRFPAKEKKKIAVLRKIAEQFDDSRKYTEIEINNVIEGIYEDIATIRRYLIQYGFLDRTSDCSEYWVKK